MNGQDIQFLQHRILQLERRQRVLMGLNTKAASQSVILRGQGLQILDVKGRPRIELKVDNGSPSINLTDETTKVEISLAFFHKEPTIGVHNYSTGSVAELSVDPDGSPYLSLIGKRAVMRVDELGLGLTEFGTHNSAVLGSSGIILRMGTADKQKSLDLVLGGLPHLNIQDADGYATTVGSTRLVNKGTGAETNRTAASVVLFDKDGNVIWSTP